MKNMRIWALIICVLVVFASLVACNSNKNDDVTQTEAPTTEAPTQAPVVTEAPTTEAPTEEPTTEAPTTEAPTEEPTTEEPTTEEPTTEEPTTEEPTTEEPTTEEPTTEVPTECTHTGGTATCTAKAICENCGEAYGELNAENHSGSKEWTKTETTHKEAWACCGVVVTVEAAHEGGAATCTAKAVCSVCEKAYGEVNADAHTVEATWTEKTETTHTKAYTCCGVKVVDAAPHAFNADGACTECGLNCEHKGGTATCTAKAVCSVCNNAYGEVNANAHTAAQAWTKTETTHTYAYTCCGAATIDEAHEWNNGVCYECVYVCEHEGGTATCSSRPICTICAKYYGTTNPDNHTGVAIWYGEGNTETTHNKLYICCGADVVATEAHKWVDGVCAECGHVCAHNGGDAKCNELATCEWCGEKYGELEPADHALEATWTTKNTTTHELIYTCCDTVVVAAEGHEWENGVCTECGYTCQHNTVADKWEDGVCTNCGLVCGHEGGDATCQTLATCVICGELYGEFDADDHEKDAKWTTVDNATHKFAYECCGAFTDEPVAHTFENGVCTGCGYGCVHTGGTATCTDAKVCTNCGQSYGEVDPANHTESEAWTSGTTTHSKAYTCCGEVTVAETAHNWVAGVCSDCNYACVHTGGAATCTTQAVCDTCGTSYGALAAHTGGTATCVAQAVCDACGVSYGSKNSTNHAYTVGTAPWSCTDATCDKYCACGEHLFSAFHSFNGNGQCTTCGRDNNVINLVRTTFASAKYTDIPVGINGSGTYTVLLYKGTDYDPANALNNLVMYYASNGGATGFKAGGGAGISIYDQAAAQSLPIGTYTIRIWNSSNQVVDARVIQLIDSEEVFVYTAREIYNTWKNPTVPNNGWGIDMQLLTENGKEFVRITTTAGATPAGGIGAGRLFLSFSDGINHTYSGKYGVIALKYRGYSYGSIGVWCGNKFADWSKGAKTTIYTGNSSDWLCSTAWSYNVPQTYGTLSLDLYTGIQGATVDIMYVSVSYCGGGLNNALDQVYG